MDSPSSSDEVSGSYGESAYYDGELGYYGDEPGYYDSDTGGYDDYAGGYDGDTGSYDGDTGGYNGDTGGHEADERLAHMLGVYRRTWAEFYEWERPYSFSSIQRGSIAVQTWATPTTDYACDDDVVGIAVGDPSELARAYPPLTFTPYDWRWDDEGQHFNPVVRGQAAVTGRVTRSRDGHFADHARYESCSPVNSNIYANKNELCCEFVKYGDSAKFNVRAYLWKFSSISWQAPDRDPDVWIIAASTIYRLTAWVNDDDEMLSQLSKIFCDHIDIKDIFPTGKSVREILHSLRLRDLLLWPDSAFPDHRVLAAYQSIYSPGCVMHERHDNLTEMFSTFCPKLGCVLNDCWLEPYPTGWVAGHVQASSYSNEELYAECTEKQMQPCSMGCFIQAPSQQNNAVLWEQYSDVQLLDHLLEIMPNEKPCRISQILFCSIPCHMVFARRGMMAYPAEPDRVHNIQISWADTRVLSDLTIPVRCEHDGPCTSTSGCKCFNAGTHCEQNCLCKEDCSLRLEGCMEDGAYHHHCKEEHCWCARKDRECSPIICKPAIVNSVKSPPCCNVDMQWKVPKAVKIGISKYGMGAYAAEHIKKGDFLGEYVSELFANAEGNTKGMLMKHCGLNYTFDLNPDLFADAFEAGNEMRYFNDAKTDKQMNNVEARFKIVNGSHQIAFYAIRSVAEGRELLLGYGDAYWNPKKPKKH